MVGAIVAIIVVLVLLLIVLIANIHIVPQAHAYVVERLGSYHDTWGNGLHVKIPFIDKVSKKGNSPVTTSFT